MNSLGQGSLGIGHRSSIASPPFASGADNGLSIDGITGNIVLGDPLGATGPADLLDDREIYFDANILRFSQRNTSGFEDWETSWLNNFFVIRDSVTNTKAFGVSVDYAGNTGVYLSNERTEPGYIPPFLRFSDVGSNSSARFQWTEENALEMTNDFNLNAFSFFPVSGNVAIGQTARQPDPQCNLLIEGNGIDVMAFFYDVNGNYLEIDQINGNYLFGAGAGAGNGNTFGIEDANNRFVMENPGGEFLVIDPGNTQNILKMANCEFVMDGANDEISLQADSARAFLIDTIGGQYVLGDVNSNYNGLRFVIDRAGNYGDLTNDTFTAAYHINSTPGVSGSFTAQSGEVVTVEGGIITGIV